MNHRTIRGWIALHCLEGGAWLIALLRGAHRLDNFFAPTWMDARQAQWFAAALLFSAGRITAEARREERDTFWPHVMGALLAAAAVVGLLWHPFGEKHELAWAPAIGIPLAAACAVQIKNRALPATDWAWIVVIIGACIGTHFSEALGPVTSLPGQLSVVGLSDKSSGAIHQGELAAFGGQWVGMAKGPDLAFEMMESEPIQYTENERVQYKGQIYRCIHPHTASHDFAADVAHWDLMLRPQGTHADSIPAWAPGKPGTKRLTFDAALAGGFRCAVHWLSPDKKTAIVSITKIRGLGCGMAGLVWLIVGTWLAAIRSLRASLQPDATP